MMISKRIKYWIKACICCVFATNLPVSYNSSPVPSSWQYKKKKTKNIPDDEIDVDEENDRQKERQLEGLRNEIVQWKKLLTDSKEPKSGDGSGNDSLQNIFKDYEKVLSAEQLQYIRSAVDYEKWLAESNEFRKQIAYYLSKRQLIDILRADFEEDAKVRIEAVATTDYVNHFDVNQYPLWHGCVFENSTS